MYSFALLDPRPTPLAHAVNDAIFAGAPTLGIEVTLPALAERCTLGNIDPQHSGGNVSRAAIEECLECLIPPQGATLVTVRPDLDAVGSMAVLALRADARAVSDETRKRITYIAMADRFARGPWPGRRPLPSRDDAEGKDETRLLAAIGAATADVQLSLMQRVEMVRTWLESGAEPTGYNQRAATAERALVRAIECGALKVRLEDSRRIALVEGTHHSALLIGYRLAPVVVACNSAFVFQGGEPHRKYTIAQYAPRHVDLGKVQDSLRSYEEGWGGSPTIIGSPQGVHSCMALKDVVAIVERHLLTAPGTLSFGET